MYVCRSTHKPVYTYIVTSCFDNTPPRPVPGLQGLYGFKPTLWLGSYSKNKATLQLETTFTLNSKPYTVKGKGCGGRFQKMCLRIQGRTTIRDSSCGTLKIRTILARTMNPTSVSCKSFVCCGFPASGFEAVSSVALAASGSGRKERARQ